MSLNEVNFVPSNPGTPTVPKYKSIVNGDGSITLIQDGVRYLQDEIQSYEEQCNVNNIMRRYVSGDVTALGAVQGTFADIFDIPKTRQEALQAIMDAQAAFAELPLEVRQRFNGSWEAFYLAGPKAIYEAYGIKVDDDSTITDPGPVEKTPEE